MTEQPQSEPITQFGKYLLDGEIARGGMSRVYRARLRGPGGFEKKLVVKQILPALAQDPSFIKLFVEEANTLVQMGHSNIVPVYELGVVDGVYYLAMELVRGATVAEILKQAPLETAHCVHIGVQVCEALSYAHERFSLVHRDVTPRNVIIDAEGHARLLDFGIAAPLERTGSGGIFGSPGYMSPEQRRGEVLSEQSDLFSLGTVLYEALTGQRAIGRISESGITDDAPRKLDEADGVSPRVAEVINSLLSTDPEQRPESARSVARSLRTWLAERHPQGVASELGARAEQARLQRPEPRPEGERQAGASRTPSNAPGLTRSIATSAALDDIVSQVTEPLPRPSREPAPKVPPAVAPEVEVRPEPVGRGVPRSTLIGVGGALLAAIVLLIARPPLSDGDGAQGRQLKVEGVVARSPQAAPKASEFEQTVPPSEPKPATPQPAAPEPAAPEPTAPEPTAPGAASQQRVEAVASSAYVTVNATPWASLSVDGRAIGNTPQRKLSLRAGKHTIAFECPPLGRNYSLPVELSAGEHKRIVVDLTAEPPKVSVHGAL